MDLTTISSVSKQLNISTRTLRYYEEIGLIKSLRQEGYSYRVYDEKTMQRIKHIILLKTLNIKLKDIARILDSKDAMTAVNIFQQEISSIDASINSLNAVKSMLNELISRLKANSYLLSAESLLDKDIADVLLPMYLNNSKKENINMSNVKASIENGNSLETVRIIHIPPSYVAASQHYGVEPEGMAQKNMLDFAKKSNLAEMKPDLRIYGFNNPMPCEGKKEYSYEYYITIPDNMGVAKPLKKKYFEGGLYAAYCIKMGDFHKWAEFSKWVEKSKEYEYEKREPLGMFGSLEEHLNAFNFVKDDTIDMSSVQLDLLIPVKKREDI